MADNEINEPKIKDPVIIPVGYPKKVGGAGYYYVEAVILPRKEYESIMADVRKLEEIRQLLNKGE